MSNIWTEIDLDTTTVTCAKILIFLFDCFITEMFLKVGLTEHIQKYKERKQKTSRLRWMLKYKAGF